MAFGAIGYILLQAALFALSILLAPKPDLEDARPSGLGEFRFPTATEGRVVPIVWGTCRVKAPNVIWYGDLFVQKLQQSVSTGLFSKSKIIVGYEYSVGIDFAICEGPVNSVLDIEVGNRSLTDLTASVTTGSNTGNGVLTVTSISNVVAAETWTFTYNASGRFAVSGSVSGAQTVQAETGKAYYNAAIGCIIKKGSVAFVTGDSFQVVVVAGAPIGVTPSDSGTTVNILKTDLFGGKRKGGGLNGALQVYTGTPNQQKDSYLVSVLGTDVPGYVNVCHAVWRRGIIGESTQIKDWVFVVNRFPDNLALTSNNHIVNGTDANPAEVIYELMTNTRWGLAISASDVDLASFQAAGNTLFTENNGFSLILDTSSKAEDVIADVLRQIDGVLYQIADGKFFLKLIRQDYTLATTPILDETNIIRLTNFNRGSWSETFNDVSVKYFDSTDDYKETFAMGQDLANFEIQGVKRAAQLTYPGIKSPVTAQQVAMRDLKSLSFPHAKASITVTRAHSALRPGDVIRLTWEDLAIVQLPMRVSDVDLGELANGEVQLELVQDIFGVAEVGSFAPPTNTSWTRQSTVAIKAPNDRAFDSPYWFILTDSDVSGTTGERIISVAQRPNGLHIQFRQFVSTTGGFANFVDTGIAAPNGFTPTGLLVSDYSESTADIETSNLLVISGGLDILNVIQAATSADIQEFGFNMMIIDDEILAFETFLDNGDGTITLQNVHRGLLDTLPAKHNAGTRIWVFHEGSVFSSTAYTISTAWVRNPTETETSAMGPGTGSDGSISVFFDSRTKRPLPAGFFRVNTARYPGIQPIGDLALTWAHRNRNDVLALNQSDGDSSLGLPASHQYRATFNLYNNGTVGTQLREITQTTTSYTYTAANQLSDNGGVQPQAIRIRLRTEDTGLSLNNRSDVLRVVELFPVGTKSVDFDGSTESMLSTTSTLGFANVWTIGMWVKRSDADTVVRTYLDVREAAGNINRVIVSRKAGTSDTLRVQVYDSAGTLFKDHEFSGQLSASVWTHLAIAFDGGEATDPLRVYRGGVLRTPSATPTDTTGTMTDTSRLVEIPTTFLGRMHAIGFWNVELSSAEVTGIYNVGDGSDFNLNYDKNGYVSRANLRHWWRLGEDSSPDGDIGKEYALTPSPGAINLSDAQVNITSADVQTDAP